MNRSRFLLSLLLIFLSFSVLWNVSLMAQELRIGRKAPKFELPELIGDSIYASKDIFPQHELTVLILWTSYCPDCWVALKSCRDLDTTLAKMNVAIIGINFDTEKLATVRGFIKGEKINFVNLSDYQKKVARVYKAESYDFSTFIVDKNGILRYVSYDHPPDVDRIILQEVERILKAKENDTNKNKNKPEEPEESEESKENRDRKT